MNGFKQAIEKAGLGHQLRGKWKLEGYDTFSNESYGLDGEYKNEMTAIKAARKRLAGLEKNQPSCQSGGQGGIQDQVFIVRPDGTKYRFLG